MGALREFADFIIHNKAMLAATYAKLLEERGGGYENFTNDRRIASGRKLLNAVVESYRAESFEPLSSLFVEDADEAGLRWGAAITPAQPMLEIECLGQTLTAVVTNLDAGKFLWRMLADVRSTIFQPTASLTTPINIFEADQEIIKLKQRIVALTKLVTEFETVAQVSKTVATILEPDTLLQTVVDLTKERFGLYHAHIYLLNQAEGILDLAAGTGEVGRQMIDDGWHISFEQEASLVARAARNQQAIVVNDVRDNTGFLPNPRLPNTRAEMAVPMIVGDKVIGVFDVQADEIDSFTKNDVIIQTALASQIAIALENARLFEETSRRAVREKTIREITEKMRTANSLEQLIKMAAQELSQRFSAEYTLVEFGTETSSENAHSSPKSHIDDAN